METKNAHLRTEHFTFVVKLLNEVDHTYFGCCTWRALCKAYRFHEGMQIAFDLGHEDDHENNIDIWLHVDHMIPVLSPCEFVNKFVK